MITLVPQHTIAALNLQLVTDDIDLRDGTGRLIPGQRMYRADIQLGSLGTHTVGVVGTDDVVIFLGRDIIDEYIATFDAPGRAVTLDWTASC